MPDKKHEHDQPLSQPDPETLHTTDPEEHMEGPVSSTMQGIKEKAEEGDTKKAPNREPEEKRESD
jgi:hypothetical protein